MRCVLLCILEAVRDVPFVIRGGRDDAPCAALYAGGDMLRGTLHARSLEGNSASWKVFEALDVLKVMYCVLLCILLCILDASEVMRRIILCMNEVVEGVLYLLRY